MRLVLILQDRFAAAQSRPPVDAQQDWFLDGGMEMDGFTILAFRRDWVTCDELDREIKVYTALSAVYLMLFQLFWLFIG